MKKIFVAVICFVIFCNFSVCQAVNVRLTDEGVETFYSSVSNNFSNVKTKIYLSNLLRTANLDVLEHNMRAWSCAYYLKDYSEPIGEIIFCVDNEGYVYMIKIVSYYNQTENFAGDIIASIFFSAGMAYEESNELIDSSRNFDKMKIYGVWCQAKNRNFVLMELPRVNSSEGKQFVLAASVK